MNNIGVISTKFPRTIGQTTIITDPSKISTITGEIDLGFMAFDEDGTLGVCTAFSRDTNTNPIYTFRTTTLNAEIDIQSILSQNY